MNDEQNKIPASGDREEETLIYRNNRELFYSFDRETGFTRKVGYQYSANQEIIRQSWDAAEERLVEVRERVLSGRVSPIAYHMERCLMEIPMLAAYMEISKWRVRRHLKPAVYNKLSDKMKNRYAVVFETDSMDIKEV
jgi:hypothetical protein